MLFACCRVCCWRLPYDCLWALQRCTLFQFASSCMNNKHCNQVFLHQSIFGIMQRYATETNVFQQEPCVIVNLLVRGYNFFLLRKLHITNAPGLQRACLFRGLLATVCRPKSCCMSAAITVRPMGAARPTAKQCNRPGSQASVDTYARKLTNNSQQTATTKSLATDWQVLWHLPACSLH